MHANPHHNTFAPRRPLGGTGFVASMLGIGDLADRSLPLETCVATARRAIDAGLNVIDTAPAYEGGYSETIVGEAVQGYRDQMFVITKIDELDEPVAPQVEGSLRRLQLDYADLFVLHGLSSTDGWEQAIAPGGLMDQLDACRAAGKLRFRGLSSHHPDVLANAIRSGACDVIMFPVGAAVLDRYVEETLPLAKEHGVGTVCFKTFGAGKLMGDTPGYNEPLRDRPRGKFSSGGVDEGDGPVLPSMSVTDCLHYTLTCDPDVTLLGLSYPNEQDAAFAAARSFREPLSRERMAALREEALVALQGKGPCWWNPDPVAHLLH